MKTLYLFATSERPDAYINTLAYAIQHLNATAIYVIVISEHDYAEESRVSTLLAMTVVSNINEQLRALSTGKYIRFSNDPNGRLVEPLPDGTSTTIYQRCLDTMDKNGTTGIAIPHSNLDKTLRAYVSKGNCLFDVSALKKNLLVDVVATLLSIGFGEVYSFELKNRPTFGQRDLIHNLTQEEDFVFRNLTSSDSVAQSLRRISRWSARSKAILIFTALLCLIFIPLSVFWRDSEALASLNVAAIAASIGSYLFLLVRDNK